MRSRSDDVEPWAAVERALERGLCGMGAVSDERSARRLDRFAAVPDGAVMWTRDPDGRFVRGVLTGPLEHDRDPAAVAVDLVHVRRCRWSEPVEEHRAPPAVVATYARGGRNFQRVRAL
ncbi:GAF domain-containing protein [Nocardioides sp. W7]|uniref:GAF domain-containing protein n=1 Tax=Nocardioides sp. W7 TaxID=2931390 RepID=UPI001FD47C12|nr:GAF domain-containing protein [Nocardioides sp. W7]